ncbi:hypothetical protein DSM110093_03842 (plasmid) [Sulfitobacter sp. DSM 110093]|uniref:hypothetical protein n=1 Tax=Sulfitobacter sp. DSM 110093 TaxID=2883127 RepID=UPI001FAD7706|nr:hypothetical protein [Sulfitobacter sp. DSM 110093]UOA33746.1 hypothetical protein DSM110093_03581 [Sulfitobacter sp. DSM 110093]UOA34007.1 hypothetical protein DSM110093_03842 [Sulfitobacter sp. DSM 110093]
MRRILKPWKVGICGLGVALASSATAQNITFEGEAGLIARSFLHDGKLPEQSTQGTHTIASLRLAASGDLSFGRWVTELNGSNDLRLGTQSFDVTKAYVEGRAGRLRYLIGSDVVHWGVTEAANPVNIINQYGSFFETDEEQRLGQPMAVLSFDTQTYGSFSFFALAGFREQDYATASERLRFNAVPDDNRTMFEDKDDLDIALRHTHTFSFAEGSLDYGLSFFSGTDRQPVYLPGCSFRSSTVSEATCTAINADIRGAYENLGQGSDDPLAQQVFDAANPATQGFLASGDSVGSIAYYQNIHQVGLELAYTTGDWQLKFEGAQKFTDREDYFSGVVGAEYSFGDAFRTGGDLRAAAEYIYDGRSSRQPQTFLDNDLFATIRYDFNDFRDTTIAMSGLYDVHTDSNVLNVNLSFRLSDSARMELSSTFVDADDPEDPLTSLDGDDFFELGVKYFF